MRYIFILYSRTFWEVRPATKRGMKLLLDYINMVRRADPPSASEGEKK